MCSIEIKNDDEIMRNTRELVIVITEGFRVDNNKWNHQHVTTLKWV
jgi:hypothetical protein